MQVVLIRHAEAVDETLELRDPHRHLTAHGRAQARSLGERLRWHDCEPTEVWTSPLVRAVQTAELVTAGVGAAIVSVPALAPSEDVRPLVARLSAMAAEALVVIVGHEPSLSGIGAVVTGRSDFPALAKCEAARIVDGELRWLFAWNAEAPRKP